MLPEDEEVSVMLSGRYSSLHRVLTFTGLLGVPALFLPFTFDVSPARGAIDASVWHLGAPFFLSLLISSASVHWLFWGKLSPLERRIAYFASGGMIWATLSFLIDGRPSAEEWVLWMIAVLTLVLGVYLVVRNWRVGPFRELSAVMSMQIAYLANCFLCLVGFFPDWQIGAYFSLATAVVYSAQIAVTSRMATPDQGFRK